MQFSKYRCLFNLASFQLLTIEGSQCTNVVSQLSSYGQGLFDLQIGLTGGGTEGDRHEKDAAEV